MNPFLLNETQIIVWGLIFLRVIAFMFSCAVFSSSNVNLPIKVLLSLVLSVIIYLPQGLNVTQVGTLLEEQLILLSIKEIFVGLVIGTVTRLFFFTMSMAGDMISVSLGLNSAQLFNPMLGAQTNVIEQFQTLIAILIFFLLQGHHLLVTALFQSFDLISVLNLNLKFDSFAQIAALGTQLIEVAIKISAPIMTAILITNITMGILGRTVPQLNVLMTSFAITISIGLFVMIFTLPLVVTEMNGILNLTSQYVFQLMRSM